MFDHFCVSFAQEVHLYSLHRKCNCRDYSDYAADAIYLRRSKKRRDKQLVPMMSQRTRVWKLDNFYDIPWGYHHVPYLIGHPGFTLWYRPPPRRDYARPGIIGCTQKWWGASFGKRSLYLVGSFNLFLIGMIGWNNYIIVTNNFWTG